MNRNWGKQSQWSKYITKTLLAVLLAVNFGTSSAFADEGVPSVQTPIKDAQSVDATIVSEGKSAGLVPGNFFYFIKTIYESIRLALAGNDLKEAQLLAEFAHNRLSEANALLARGKVDEAKQSIQKSLEVQQSAVEKADQVSGASVSVSSSIITQEQTSVQTTGVKLAEAAVDEKPAEQLKVKDEEQVLKVKTDLQHNIVALTAALEKVENPKAQLALMKNIEKSFAHLESKLEKNEHKQETKVTLQPMQSKDVQVASVEAVQENAAEAAEEQERIEQIYSEAKPEKAEKPERAEKPEVTEKAEKEDKHEKHDRTDKKQKNNDRDEKGNEKNNGNHNNGNHNK